MTTNQQILDRAHSRREAQGVYELAADLGVGWTTDKRMAFWIWLMNRVSQHVDEADRPMRVIEKGPLAAMTGEETSAFECADVPFGKHQGIPVGQTPLGYLDWLDGQPDFRRQLDRYLRNDRVKREPREGSGE